MTGQFRRIATEEAFSIPEQMAAMRELVRKSDAYDPDLFLWEFMSRGGQLTQRLLDLEGERLQIMDAAGIDMQLLALTSTGVQMLDAERGIALAALANDRLADLIRRYPQRYAGLCTIAPQDPAAAAREIERCITSLKLNGVMINSHTQGEYLDQPKFRPILEAAAALDVPIYIHPRSPAPAMAAPYRDYHLEHAVWGYAAEVGLHAVRLIMSGVFDRLPALRIVIGHMGENIPYALYRMDWMHAMTSRTQMMQRPVLEMRPSDYFKRNFAITTSGVNWDPALKLCMEVLGSDNILWAVDYPYQETLEATRWLDNAPIPDADKDRIFHGNAERIFKIATPAGT
jgi:predicted TIM-barrel fold metal-dependent hydrolase